MNKIFKVIWNHTTQSFMVVSELARSRGKSRTSTDERGTVKTISLTAGSAAALLMGVIGASGTAQADTTYTDVHDRYSSERGILYGDNITVNSDHPEAFPSYVNNVSAFGDEIDIGPHDYSKKRLQNGNIWVGGHVWGGTGSNITTVGRHLGVHAGDNVFVAGNNNIIWTTVNREMARDGTRRDVTIVGNTIKQVNMPDFGGVAVGNYIDANNNLFAVGANITSHASSGAVGRNLNVTSRTVAMGDRIKASGASSVMGVLINNEAEDRTSIVHSTVHAYNLTTKAVDNSTISASLSALAAVNNSTVIGNKINTANKLDNSVILGSNINLSQDVADTIVIGNASNYAGYVNVTSATVGGVTYQGFAANSSKLSGMTMSIGAEGKERQLKNVAAGQITATSTDAINGSQLYAVASVASSALQNFTTSVNGKVAETINKDNKDINFVNGTATTARNSNNNITFDVNVDGSTIKVEGNNLTVNTAGVTIEDGKATKPEGDAGKALVNLTTVTNAINNVSHTITTNQSTAQVVASNNTFKVNAGDKVNYVAGKNLVVNMANTGENVTNVTFGLAKDIAIGGKGADGKNGVDGSIGVQGADGKTGVGLNGKDGSIGINGKDGVSANITVAQGPKGIDGNDGKDGKTKTRIVYVKPDGTKENVSTLNDGLYFAGDTGTDVARKLNTKLNIVGGQKDQTKLTDNNIGVVADGTDKLTIKLAKDIDLGKDGSINIGDTKINNGGFTINGGPSITKGGIDLGNKKITNVSNGTAPTDAVNVSQLKAGRTTVTSSDNSISVVDTNKGAGDNFAYDIKVNGQSVVENAQLPVVYSDTNGNKLYKQADGSFNTKADGKGTKVESKDVIASMNNGDNSTTSPMSLTNVKGSLTPSYNTGDNFIDPATGKPTSPADLFANTSMVAPTTEQVKAMYNNAATVGDVLNAGWNLQGNGEAKDFVKPYDTVNFINGIGTKAVIETAKDGKSSTVTFNIDTDGKTLTTETKDVPVVDKDGKPVVDSNGNPVTTKETIIKANTGNLTVNNSGNITLPVGDEGDKLTNTTTVANAINNAFHTITTNQSTAQVVASNETFKVNVGDKVNYVAGKNLVVNMTNTGENETTVTFGLGKDITVGGKGADGKDGVDGSFGVKGADGKTGVGLNGKDGSIGIDGKDGTSANITVAQGPKGIDGNDGKDGKTRIVYVKPNGEKEDVATLNDGLYFQGDNTDVTVARKLNSQLNVTGGYTGNVTAKDNIKVTGDVANATLKIQLGENLDLGANGSFVVNGTTIHNNGTISGVADGDISPNSSEAVNGSQLYNLTQNFTAAIANTTISNEAGKAKAPEGKEGGKLVNATTVANAINETYHTVNVTNNNNQVVAGGVASQINPGDKVNYVAGKNLVANTTGEADGTTNIVYGLAKDVELETVTVKGEPGAPGADGKPGATPSVALNGKDGSIGINGKDGSNADITVEQGQKGLDGNDGKDGESKTRIVYTKPDGKKEEVATLNDGLIFAGDSGKDVERKLNTKLTVKGAETTGSNGKKVKNITVETDPATSSLNVKLAKDVDLGNDGSIKAGGVTINKGGINAGGKKITNVAPGTNGTDAVNVNQFRKGLGDVHNRINKVDKNLRAGVAGAMATAGLYHATLPGKSMISAGAGTYKGQSAVAVGYSSLSDNGKIGVKFSLNTNTRGDSGAAASVGYQW